MKPTNTKLIAETANIVRLQLVSDKEFCFPNLMFFWCNCGKKKKENMCRQQKVANTMPKLVNWQQHHQMEFLV